MVEFLFNKNEVQKSLLKTSKEISDSFSTINNNLSCTDD